MNFESYIIRFKLTAKFDIKVTMVLPDREAPARDEPDISDALSFPY